MYKEIDTNSIDILINNANQFYILTLIVKQIFGTVTIADGPAPSSVILEASRDIIEP